MTATPNEGTLLRLPNAAPAPLELKTGYGWCDLHQGFAYITNPKANDAVTGIHGACKGCVDGRARPRRI